MPKPFGDEPAARRGLFGRARGGRALARTWASRLVLFHWRTDDETPAILWGLKQAQITSLAVLAAMVPVLAWAWRRRSWPASDGEG